MSNIKPTGRPPRKTDWAAIPSPAAVVWKDKKGKALPGSPDKAERPPKKGGGDAAN